MLNSRRQLLGLSRGARIGSGCHKTSGHRDDPGHPGVIGQVLRSGSSEIDAGNTSRRLRITHPAAEFDDAFQQPVVNGPPHFQRRATRFVDRCLDNAQRPPVPA